MPTPVSRGFTFNLNNLFGTAPKESTLRDREERVDKATIDSEEQFFDAVENQLEFSSDEFINPIPLSETCDAVSQAEAKTEMKDHTIVEIDSEAVKGEEIAKRPYFFSRLYILSQRVKDYCFTQFNDLKSPLNVGEPSYISRLFAQGEFDILMSIFAEDQAVRVGSDGKLYTLSYDNMFKIWFSNKFKSFWNEGVFMDSDQKQANHLVVAGNRVVKDKAVNILAAIEAHTDQMIADISAALGNEYYEDQRHFNYLLEQAQKLSHHITGALAPFSKSKKATFTTIKEKFEAELAKDYPMKDRMVSNRADMIAGGQQNLFDDGYAEIHKSMMKSIKEVYLCKPDQGIGILRSVINATSSLVLGKRYFTEVTVSETRAKLEKVLSELKKCKQVLTEAPTTLEGLFKALDSQL